MDLSSVSTYDLECELRTREWKRQDEIRAAEGYHVRMLICELVRKLERQNILWKHKAIQLDKALFWLEYKEYCNEPGGVIFGLRWEMNGELYFKNHLEAMCCDIEVGEWLKLLSTK
jgi:hypothetical protein